MNSFGSSSLPCAKYKAVIKHLYANKLYVKTLMTKADRQIQDCYHVLNIPIGSKQDVVRQAFLDLAKKYHPDSGSSEANIDKFVSIENAFRTLTKHNTGKICNEEIAQIVHDIKHVAPQHRQYLSFEGVGHGTPFQRQKQWQQARAQKAAENVMDHRLSKSVASENALMKKGTQYGKKHDIKTKYGFDRLVEDLIQESMSKGEFEKLSGIGKPLKDQNTNPYVDFTTHKLNEVLINNGFTPEWIMMNKEIDQDIEALREELIKDRMYLGPYPLSPQEVDKWKRIYKENYLIAKSINNKINKFNLIVPLMSKQRFHVEFEEMAQDILQNGRHSVVKDDTAVKEAKNVEVTSDSTGDFIGLIFKVFGEIFRFGRDDKKKNDVSR